MIGAAKIETTDIGARVDCALPEFQLVLPTGNFLPNGFLGVERFARLIDIGQFHRLPQSHRALVRLFLPRNHFEERSFSGAVGADNAHDTPGRHFERHIFKEDPVVVGLF